MIIYIVISIFWLTLYIILEQLCQYHHSIVSQYCQVPAAKPAVKPAAKAAVVAAADDDDDDEEEEETVAAPVAVKRKIDVFMILIVLLLVKHFILFTLLDPS